MLFSTYNKSFFITAGMLLIPLFGLTLYMHPLSNELTRMGGYLENDYGWNLPQEHFNFPLFKKAESINDYSHYYDVVVLGDSFSDNESNGWQNYFVNKTGLKTISFNMFSISVEEILNSPIYLEHPPKLFIYESVERGVTSRHNECDIRNGSKERVFSPPLFRLNPLNKRVSKKERDKRLISAEKDIGTATNYISKLVSRSILNLNITEVERLDLKNNRLFSSKVKNSILLLTRDFKVKDIDNEQIETAKCSLLSLQNKIRVDNVTEFIVIVFPNKTSVYSDFIQDTAYSNMNIISKLESTPGLNITHLFDDYLNSVNEGVVDFYLPNDTHCGYYAYQQAADAVIRLIDQ